MLMIIHDIVFKLSIKSPESVIYLRTPKLIKENMFILYKRNLHLNKLPFQSYHLYSVLYNICRAIVIQNNELIKFIILVVHA